MIIEKEFKSYKLTKEVIETRKIVSTRTVSALSEEDVKNDIEKDQSQVCDIYSERGDYPSDLLSRKVTIKIEEVK